MEIKSDKSTLDIISQIKSLLLITDEEKDALLKALLENAYFYAVSYTSREEIPSAVLCRMVCEDYSRPRGVVKKTRSGMSEEYLDDYSPSVKTLLSGIKRLRAI